MKEGGQNKKFEFTTKTKIIYQKIIFTRTLGEKDE
jgi:hypothetical protein